MKLVAHDGNKLVGIEVSASKSNITFCCEDGRKLVFIGSEVAKAVGVANTKIMLRNIGYLKVVKYGPSADDKRKVVMQQHFFFFDVGDHDLMSAALSDATAKSLAMSEDCKKGESVQISVWGRLQGMNVGGVPHVGELCLMKGVTNGKGKGQAAKGEGQEREDDETVDAGARSAYVGEGDDGDS